MTALPAIDPTTALPEAAAALAKARAEFGGSVPNLSRVMANSPALLDGYIEFWRALNGGVLEPAVAERIALLVAEENACAYCLSAHSYVAERVLQLPSTEIAAAREGGSGEPRIRALLGLASAINMGRGEVPDHVIATAREAGVSDGEIAEVVGHVAANVLSNYFAKTAGVDIDFPHVLPRETAR